MRKLDQSVLSTILSAVLTLALLVVANRPPSAGTSAALSATPGASHWASLTAASTGVQTRASESEPLAPAAPGQKLGVGAGIQTDESGTAQLSFEHGAVVRIAPYTLLNIVSLPTAPDDPLGACS